MKSELDQLGVSKEDPSIDQKDNIDNIGTWDELQAELEELDLGDTGGAEGSDIPLDWEFEEELESMILNKDK